MTDAQRKAKIEALLEAADHLEVGHWTEDAEERKQGEAVAAELRRRADRLEAQ